MKKSQKKINAQIAGLTTLIERLLSFSIEKPPFFSLSDYPILLLPHTDKNHLVLKSDKKWVQTKLGYFDLHLNMAYRKKKVITVGRNIYYQNIVLFVQRIRDLIVFKGADLVKANLATSLQGSALEWHTFKLDNTNCENLCTNQGVMTWLKTLNRHFKISIRLALGLLVDEKYTIADA